MFEKNAVLALYTVAPVHLGAGTGLGAIDNPIQRERHSGHPSFAGSGIKGAVRHASRYLLARAGKSDVADQLVPRLFGPESHASLHAGAIAFGDAQLVCLPIRSFASSFVYATCPFALARAARLIENQLGNSPNWTVPIVEDGTARIANTSLLSNGQLVLESFDYRGISEPADVDVIASLAQSIAANVLPVDTAGNFFRDKLASDLVVLSDADFGYFAETAMQIEAHVRISEKTGAAAEGGLFYTENLPPESILLAPIACSRTRDGKDALDADTVFEHTRTLLDGQLLQIGGDATTGRGLVAAHVIEAIEASA